MSLPLARSLEPIPFEHEGQSLIALRDPTGICPELCVLQPVAYVLWSLMDGRSSLEQIQDNFRDRFGGRVDSSLLSSLVTDLENHMVLECPAARARLDAFPTRPAAHAGAAYPRDAGELKTFLDDIIDQEEPPEPAGRLLGMLTPHIDLARGSRSYSLSYGELRRTGMKSATVFVLGISHALSRTPFILTRKNFETPLGEIPTAVELVDQLVEACDFDPFQDEYNQFGEHSIEFQAVFLRHLFPEGLRMVPILCGSFHEALTSGGDPRDLPGVRSFLNRLTELVRSVPDALVIAGADLAHVGERFGGERLSENDLQALGVADQESLAQVVANDQLKFFATLQADGGARNYCGTAAIFSMMEALDLPARLHLYQQCNEPQNTSTVTVCSASLYQGA